MLSGLYFIDASVLIALLPDAASTNVTNLLALESPSSETDTCAATPADKDPAFTHLVSVPSEDNTCPAEPKSPSPSLNSPSISILLKVVKPVIFAPDVIFKFFTSTSANTDLLKKFAVPFTSNFVFFDMSIPSPPKNVLLKKVTLA